MTSAHDSHGPVQQGHEHESDTHVDTRWELIERIATKCPICAGAVFGAQGRGYCKECNITFALPGRNRKEIIAEFLVRYYLSRNSPFYHRTGCRYIRNIEPENLIVVTVPLGKPCQCIGR